MKPRSRQIRPRAERHRSADAEYRKSAAAYLKEHPFCQVTIAVWGFDEAEVISRKGFGFGRFIPQATEVHHRNKRSGSRKNDARWWIAACRRAHDWIETHLSFARANGLSLPIQADEEGRWGDGNQALPTPEFMRSKIGKPISYFP